MEEKKKLPLMLMMKHVEREWAAYLRRITADVGIPDAYIHIIMQLNRFPGSTQKELAAHQNVTSAAISQTVKEMQLCGLIRKETDENDRRFAKLYLTEKGMEYDDRIRDKIQNAERMITEALGPDGEERMTRMLGLIHERISADGEK